MAEFEQEIKTLKDLAKKHGFAVSTTPTKSGGVEKLWKETQLYDGNVDSRKFIQQFEFKAMCAAVEDDKGKKMALLSSLDTIRYDEVYSTINKDLKEASYKEIVDCLHSLYAEPIQIWHEIAKFGNEKMIHGDKVLEYFHRLKKKSLQTVTSQILTRPSKINWFGV